jgi:hypothetical protein
VASGIADDHDTIHRLVTGGNVFHFGFKSGKTQPNNNTVEVGDGQVFVPIGSNGGQTGYLVVPIGEYIDQLERDLPETPVNGSKRSQQPTPSGGDCTGYLTDIYEGLGPS